MTTGPLLDIRKTVLGLGGDETLFGKVAQIFVRITPDLLSSINAAITDEDLKRVYMDAHSLKGSVGVFEAPEVLVCVADVARHAKNSDLAATKHAFAAAQPLVERLLVELVPVVSAARAAAGSDAR